jgi:hypothetical protein
MGLATRLGPCAYGRIVQHHRIRRGLPGQVDLVLNWFQRIVFKDFLHLLSKGKLTMLDFSQLDVSVAAAKAKLATAVTDNATISDLTAKLAAKDAQEVIDQAKIADLTAQLNATP